MCILQRMFSHWRHGVVALMLVLVSCLVVSGCGAGIYQGEYTYHKLTIEIYEGLGNMLGKGLTKASVSCDQDEKLIGGGFRTNDVTSAPMQIAASYPSHYAGNEVTAGTAPTAWTVEAYSSVSGSRIAAYAVCLQSPTTVQGRRVLAQRRLLPIVLPPQWLPVQLAHRCWAAAF